MHVYVHGNNFNWYIHRTSIASYLRKDKVTTEKLFYMLHYSLQFVTLISVETVLGQSPYLGQVGHFCLGHWVKS